MEPTEAPQEVGVEPTVKERLQSMLERIVLQSQVRGYLGCYTTTYAVDRRAVAAAIPPTPTELPPPHLRQRHGEKNKHEREGGKSSNNKRRRRRSRDPSSD
uniref:Uncharacterized protein n=1 Tax=Oryza rufipogon TaxID=4529 RepID=A0A0E0MWW9_ORYRU